MSKIRIIAEIGINHNGCLKDAKTLIDQAIDSGVWGIKFQYRSLKGFFNPEISDIGGEIVNDALNRGYKKVTLLGCDYLIKAASEPIMGGHFYTNIPVYVMKFSNTYEDLLNEIDDKIDTSSYTTYKTAKCFCATSSFEKYQYLLNKKSTPPFAKEDYVNELAGIHHYHN